MPPALAVASFLKTIKGSSAHFVNHLPDVQANIGHCLYWPPGYWGMTYTQRDLPRVVRYVDNQKRYHAEGTLLGKLEYIPPVPEQWPHE